MLGICLVIGIWSLVIFLSVFKNIFIGTSGFYYYHWVGKFYPEDIRRDEVLPFYSRHFNTVEINSSFYHIPRKTTVEKWEKSVPESFVFSLKFTRILTHLKPLHPELQTLEKFFSSLEPLKKKETIILIQLPARLKLNLEKLSVFTNLLPKDFKFAFEFRHKSWFCEEVYDLFKKKNMAIVLSDSPIKKSGERLWPKVEVETADFFYIRFHGSKELYRSSYSDEELEKYAELITQKVKKGLKVFAYFNNDAEGWAIENAKRLKELLAVDK